MLKAKDIMVTDVISVTPDTEIPKAADILLKNHINGVPVLDENGKLVGILCQSDLIAQQKKFPLPSLFTTLGGFFPLKSSKQLEKELHKIAAATVMEAMTPDPAFVLPETPVDEVATLMVDKNFHTIPVLDQGKLVGVIGKEDVLKTI